MDSGNSGSLQSSSGGSEEYDSRVESISAFLNHNPFNNIGHGALGNQPQPPSPPQLLQQHQNHSSSPMFDPLSYLDHPLSRSLQLTTTTNPGSVLNLDVIWSKNQRSETNCTDLSGFMASSPAPTTQQLFTNQQTQSRATFPLLQVPQGPESSKQRSVSATNGQPNNNAMVRNPKKRSRASRRAPTTVLTTNTTNFRAMVQEFTGIPAPPFTSSPFPRTRLDLFGPPSTLRSTHLDLSPPHYLLRPFAQKLNPPSFSSSSMADALVSSPIPSTNNNSNNTSCSSTSINYQLPSELSHLKQPQNLLNINMQNPILNFQSLLETPPKYPLSNSNLLGTKPQDIPPNETCLKMGALDEFGLNQGHVNANANLTGLQNMVSQQQHDQSLLRSINSSYNNNNNQRVSKGKVSNLSSSSSEFHADKGPENVASRSEGMVESWICSSD
ncbi:hypothetical protein ERO13_A10G085466v2 [Gossypium hirsutum]|uniref:VQ domain-containing protein n=1 Tax=Gossypium hirsutum TaxID=3635 RepID=A0A1U8K8F2_GOSHI|nr:uncharacterized protein LOC107914390 [Gossypium hirsutum]KAG4179110.1 hypothetical protein ERO13_A10G085466v2 [Gossypium hirsutum]